MIPIGALVGFIPDVRGPELRKPRLDCESSQRCGWNCHDGPAGSIRTFRDFVGVLALSVQRAKANLVINPIVKVYGVLTLVGSLGSQASSQFVP